MKVLLITLAVIIIFAAICYAFYHFAVRGGVSAVNKQPYYPESKPETKGEKPVLFKQVYDYFNENGYLRECGAEDYKFSAQRLKLLMKKPPVHSITEKGSGEVKEINLSEVDIKKTWLFQKFLGVGYKVNSLILHLIKKYKEELAN